MHALIWRDVRLHGWRPNGSAKVKVMESNFDTPLNWFINYSKGYANRIKKAKGVVHLKIMAHGYKIDGKGGYGIQFCKEDLLIKTIGRLTPLRSKFLGGVDIYACAAADVTPGSGAGTGNGAILCRRIAMIMATNVRASSASQIYGKGSGPKKGLYFGVWQGKVFTWDKHGKLIKTEIEPKM